MTTFELYLLLILPRIGDALSALSLVALIVCGGGGIIARFVGYVEEEEAATEIGNKALRWVPPATAGVLVASLFPDTAMMLALIGWELGTSIEGIGDIPANVVGLVNELIARELGDAAGS